MKCVANATRLGAPLLLIACQDQSFPAQGGLAMSIEPREESSSCAPSEFVLPAEASASVIIDHAGEDPSTGEFFRVVDGQDGVRMDCFWGAPGSSPFPIDLFITQPATVSLSVSGSVTSEGGVVRLSAWDSVRQTDQAAECHLRIEKLSQRSGLFAHFACPTFGSDCVAEGTLIFENCPNSSP